MTAHKLILLPADPDCTPVSSAALADTLQSIGLLGAASDINGATFYPTGDRFLQLITFLGCSPMIELEPPADQETLAAASRDGRFCHAFLECRDTLRFRSDPRTPTPRCPQCRAPLADWPTTLKSWRDDPANDHWHCQQCSASGRLSELGFRKTAGFSRTFVEIRGIYPSEAVPGEALLDTLKSLTRCAWSTIYIKE